MERQKIQIKLAQLNLAMRHVLRNRMQKKAERYTSNTPLTEEELQQYKKKLEKGNKLPSTKTTNNISVVPKTKEEEELYKKIGDLLKQRDKGWFSDIFGGIGKGSLYGLGIGGIGGGITGSIVGKQVGNTALDNFNYYVKNYNLKPTMKYLSKKTGINIPNLVEKSKPYFPMTGGLLGMDLGILSGAPTGAMIGGLYRLLTHNSRKQKAIDKLKELGVESNE